MRRNGTQRHRSVHRLVCRAFHGPAPEGKPVVAHYDGDPLNNRADNLRWASYLDNFEDSIRHGTKPGLDREQIRLIKAALVLGAGSGELASKYGVSRNTISRISTGKRWADVPEPSLKEASKLLPEMPIRRRPRLSPEVVRLVKAALVLGETRPAVAKRFSLGVKAVGNIKAGRTWTQVPWPAREEAKRLLPDSRGRTGRRLDHQQVLSIKAALVLGESQGDIATEFGITQAAVSSIKCGGWRSVKTPTPGLAGIIRGVDALLHTGQPQQVEAQMAAAALSD